MKGQRILVSILAVGLGLLLTLVAGLALAQGPGVEGEVGIQAALGTAASAPLSTSFTYQGRLTDGGNPANGSYDFRFILYDAEMSGSQVGSPVNKDDVTVTDGLFTVKLDFGSGIFTGDARWLEIGVRPGTSTGAYTTLTPRQALTPAPYALALPGLWTQPNATSPNVIGGYSGNSVTAGVVGATIGGGGGSGFANRVTDNYATVGGGTTNTASGQGNTIGGGNDNTSSDVYATIGGGQSNSASKSYATVGGGASNTASGNFATIPGGSSNTAEGNYSFAAGRRAKANHQGAFVWADSTDADFASTANNQFTVRANGGVAFSTGGASFRINGGDAWTSANDGSGSGLDADRLDGQDGSYYLDWNNLTNVPAGFADGVDNTGAGGDFWSLTGNAGTTGSNFLGTTDNQALELRVNNARALRLEPNADSPNLIGGLSVNWVTVGVVGATIGGGGAPSDAWGGPYYNRVTDDYGTVGGGENNQAGDNAGATDDAPYSTVAGGLGNTASGATGGNGGGATVGGGIYNAASGGGATIGGGVWNIASGDEATISGGLENTASGEQATVGGGGGNTANGDHATVGGGFLNHADALTVTIGGGEYISVTGQAATVAGGSWITVTGDYAAVGGGGYNTASGVGAVIAGGGGFDPRSLSVVTNTASGHWSTIGGGGHNAASDFGSIGGGWHNTASNEGATIGGGGFNTASGNSATVGGGYDNTASGDSATVPGGERNTAQGNYSFAAGYRAKATHDGAFVWADSTDADFESTDPDQFKVRATNGAEFHGNNNWYGLWVENGGNGDGIRAIANVSQGNNWGAVYAINQGTSPAVYADTNGTYSGYFMDDVYVDGSCVGCVIVYIGLNDGNKPLEPGDLVAVSGVSQPLAGAMTPVMRVRHAGAGSAVIGVVQSKADVVKSSKDGQQLESANRVEGAAAPGDYVFIVVQGITYVKADAMIGDIVAGQRLTAADQPGHVRALRTRMLEGMLVAEGAPVVGIALAPLDKNTGMIPVLVTLR